MAAFWSPHWICLKCLVWLDDGREIIIPHIDDHRANEMVACGHMIVSPDWQPRMLGAGTPVTAPEDRF